MSLQNVENTKRNIANIVLKMTKSELLRELNYGIQDLDALCMDLGYKGEMDNQFKTNLKDYIYNLKMYLDSIESTLEYDIKQLEQIEKYI